MLRSLSRFTVMSLLVAVPLSASAVDLKEAAPNDVYLAVWGQHNPERDYQSQYYKEIWATIQKTRIADKTMAVLKKHLPERENEGFQEALSTLKTALEPIDWESLGKLNEVLYAQKMEGPASQHLFMVRFDDEGEVADSLVAAVTNLMKLAETASDGDVPVRTSTIVGAEFTGLALPPQVPFQLQVGKVDGNVFVVATSTAMLTESLTLLNNPSGVSKFDDPRVAEALGHLPEAEDALTFFDGKQMYSQLQGIPAFIRQVSNGDPNAAKAAGLLSSLFSEINVIDYEVGVEYTEGYQNRSAAFTKLSAGARDTVAGKMFLSQQSFDNWDKWVPVNASSYSISTGVTLHPLYEWLMEQVPATFPESQRGLDRFAEVQEQYDLYLDKDFLQSFSGETVSMSFPGTTPTPFGPSSQSVFYCRCSNPERMKALIHRGVDALQQIPQVKAQGLALKEVDGRPEFEELACGIFGIAGVKPVIGFKDGWMVVASHVEAVDKVDATQSGEAENVTSTDRFQAFDLDIDGPVSGVGYRNTGQATRELAAGLQQVGAMLPMIMGMAGASGDAPELAVVSDFMSLLPSVGQIIGKFDFMESHMTVTQPGPVEDSFIRRGVMLIRPPAESVSAESVSNN